MKKIGLYLVLLLSIFVFTEKTLAASATFAVKSSSSQVIVGKNVTVYVTLSSSSALGSWEYTLNYDKSIFKLVSSEVPLHYTSYVNNNKTKSVTYKYVFQALKSGSGKFYIDSSLVAGWDENIMSTSNGSVKVKTLTYNEYQATLSKNNNLSNLSIAGYEISPKFDKNINEYSVQINEDETSVKISAALEDKKASVSGTGTFDVSAGNNTFIITVVAENGSEKTYKLNVEVIDKNPINVTLNNEEYTVVKLASNLVKPESYSESTAMINEIEVPAFYSEITEFVLVGLKDKSGNIALYIYQDGKYTKYDELNFGNITIYPLSSDEVIEGYQKSNFTVQNVALEGLTNQKNSRFNLIYGLNVETNEKGFYLYDNKDSALIKYDNSLVIELEEQNKIIMLVAVIFLAVNVICFIVIIVLINSKKKKQKPVKKEPKKTSKKEQKNQVDEDFKDVKK